MMIFISDFATIDFFADIDDFTESPCFFVFKEVLGERKKNKKHVLLKVKIKNALRIM